MINTQQATSQATYELYFFWKLTFEPDIFEVWSYLNINDWALKNGRFLKFPFKTNNWQKLCLGLFKLRTQTFGLPKFTFANWTLALKQMSEMSVLWVFKGFHFYF